MRALQREGVQDYARLHRAIRDDLRANRNLTNVVGGYWVLGIEPEAACHMETSAISLERPTMDQGLATILAAVRRLEAGDAECIWYPCFKPQDDATALLFEMRALR
jgi:hypothetical protein